MAHLKENGTLVSIYNLIKDIKNNQTEMKRKKVEVMRPNNIWDSELIKISKDYNNYQFEIGNEITYDIGEAVAILMRMKYKWNDPVWDIKIEDLDYYNIDPSKTLYWLSGGDTEWRFGTEYKYEWHQCYLDYQEEFGIIVVSIIKKSKTFKDIRNGFLKYLNLATLYNFALEKEIA